MHRVNIIGSQLVAGDLRHQHENPIEVSDAEAKRLHDAGALMAEPDPVKAAKKADPAKRKGDPAKLAAKRDLTRASEDTTNAETTKGD